MSKNTSHLRRFTIFSSRPTRMRGPRAQDVRPCGLRVTAIKRCELPGEPARSPFSASLLRSPCRGFYSRLRTPAMQIAHELRASAALPNVETLADFGAVGEQHSPTCARRAFLSAIVTKHRENGCETSRRTFRGKRCSKTQTLR